MYGHADPALNKHEEKMFESVAPMEEWELESVPLLELRDISDKVGEFRKDDEAKGSVGVGVAGGGDEGAVVVVVGSSGDEGRVVVIVGCRNEVGVASGEGGGGVVVACGDGVEGAVISCFFLRG